MWKRTEIWGNEYIGVKDGHINGTNGCFLLTFGQEKEHCLYNGENEMGEEKLEITVKCP